jgi:hypothetical protein
MSYSNCQLVAQMIPNLLNNASSFDNMGTTVVPGSAQLIRFMSTGCAIINSRLKAKGWTTPVAATATIYEWLSDIEANYACYRAELARSSARVAAGERGRHDNFKKAFEDGLNDLLELDPTLLGIGYSREDGYVGGISEAEKDSVDSDTDRVKSRFKRGQFESGEVPRPGGATADDQADEW